MKPNDKSKKMFLELAIAAKARKEQEDAENLEKLEYIHLIEKELKIAENLLDNLSEDKAAPPGILVKLNRKILDLRTRIEELKLKIKKIEVY